MLRPLYLIRWRFSVTLKSVLNACNYVLMRNELAILMLSPTKLRSHH